MPALGWTRLLVQPNLLSSVSWTQEETAFPRPAADKPHGHLQPMADEQQCNFHLMYLGEKDLTWTLTLSPFLGWHHQGQGHLRGCVLGMAKQLATWLAKHLGGRATYPPPAFALVFHRTEKQTFFFFSFKKIYFYIKYFYKTAVQSLSRVWLWPYGCKDARPPCPSLFPRVL